MKKIKPDGTVSYYYYKKKIGRHKKRGKRKEKSGYDKQGRVLWDYKIMRFDFRKQTAYIGTYHNMDEVNLVRKELEGKNKEVKFPKKFANNGRRSSKIYEYKSEYVILERVRDADAEDNVTRLRNEFGKYVEHFTTNKNWRIVDKFPCLVEETFWVYGHHPRLDRKTFTEIYDGLVAAPAEETSEIIIIYVYLNKVIFKYEDGFNFVICKNESDAIRMYNMIEENTKRIKNVVMAGAVRTKSDRGQDTVNMIMKRTGWTRRKVTSKSTRA